ncbi:MAG: hypothetical protein ACR2FS_14565 [Phormidesmis sp.]
MRVLWSWRSPLTHSLCSYHTLVAEHNGGPALPVSAPWDYYADERVDELAASNL